MGALRIKRGVSFFLLGLTWIGLLGAAQAASAAPPTTLPPYAQGHPYRHGVVPARGHQSGSLAPTSPSRNLSYGGGISGVGVTTGPPQVYLVFWGSQWGTQGTDSNGYVTLSGDPKDVAPYLQAFLKGVGTDGETWSGVMTQYCQGIAVGAQSCPSSNGQHVGYPWGGALKGVWVDESSASPGTATASQIGAEAVSAAAHFSNTTSSANRDAQYVIVSPTGANPDNYKTQGFCAWHDYTDDVSVSSPYGALAFTNLPYLPDAGGSCGENFVNSGSAGTLDGISIVEGHEYAETITDQFPAGGWTDSLGNENGDKCAWISSGQGAAQDISLSTGSFAVQSTWANDSGSGAGGCEISHPIVNNVTVGSPGNQASATGQPVTPVQVSGSDSDSSQTLTYSASGLPPGLAISPSGLITGTPSGPGVWTVTVSAADPTGAGGNASFSWTVGVHASSTSVSCGPSTVVLGSSTTCTATVSDTSSTGASAPSGNVNFAASPGGTAAMCTLSPAGATSASCAITYTPPAANSYTVTATYGGDSSHAGSSNSTLVTATAPPASGSGGSGTGTPPSTPTASPTPAAPPNGAAGAASSGPPASAVCATAGGASGATLGAVTLGMTRRQARAAYQSLVSSGRYQDLFCQTLRVGYLSPRLLSALRGSQRRSLSGRVIWAVTTNHQYSVRGVRAGVQLAVAKRMLGAGQRVRIGASVWYLVRQGLATILVKVRDGVVREIGIASPQLTRTPRAASLLIRTLP